MMPGPVIVRTVMNLIYLWAFPVFLAASDLLMILRIYAMYNRSKTILFFFLVIYIPTMALTIVPLVYKMTRKLYLSVYAAEVVDVRFCVLSGVTINLLRTYILASRLILGALLCIFAVTKFVRQSLEMHKVIKQWRSNRYMELLVRESILYFIVNFFANLMLLKLSPATPLGVLAITNCIFPFVLAPRLVISMRELHSRAVGEHIDSGFGVVSQRISPHANTIMFMSAVDTPADAAETAGVESRSEGAQVWSDDQDSGMDEEAAEGASA
ncbi:hypothetical protein PAXINDRAFT_168617 [Paxillus involutus ATCC 200175]|nr:hypothetical protein PAXINDRAFT_168617 [Paxillus involutus ATCC 200175]